MGHGRAGDEVGRGGSGLGLWDPNVFLTSMAYTSIYFSILNLILFHMNWYLICMYICVPCACLVLVEDGRGHLIPCNWS